MTTAVVTSKGQITIPKPVRDGLGVETGDRVEFVELERGVYTVVVAMRDVREPEGDRSRSPRSRSAWRT